MQTSPVILIAVAAISFLIVVPIGFLFFGMFWSSFPGAPGHLTTEFLVTAFTDFRSVQLLSNTVIFAAGSSILAITIAFLLAWIINRTDTPARRLFDILPLIVFMYPSMLGDIAWTFLLSPRVGLINVGLMNLFGFSSPDQLSQLSIFGFSPLPFNIYGMGGMIWSQSLSLAALAYLLIGGTFGTMDPSLEEAARMSGASTRKTIFKVTLPLISPALLSTGALVFMIGVNSFETPVFIGLPAKTYVFMSRIFEKIGIESPPDYGGATALAFISLLVSSVAVTFYLYTTRRLRKYVVVTGKGYRPKVIKLGRLKYLALGFLIGYIFLAIGLPIFIMLLMSFMRFYSVIGVDMISLLTFDNYAYVTQEPLIYRAALNSFTLAILAAILTTGAAAIMSYLAIRSRIKGKRALEFVSALPVAYPGMIFSLALVWTALFIFRPIYGTIGILVLAYIVVFLPYAMRALSNSMIQLHSELEEAARTSGATSLYTIFKITLPMIKPALINTLILVFIQSYRQLGAAAILVTPDTFVLPVVILHWWTSGLLVALSAATMVFGGILVIAVMVARYVFKASFTF
ncbi:MAG: iron ABC transporter permease [Thaumarchaeota archaeon]|nr:iron ABC transporter permease [Nitrososphaerota archaeon]